MCGSPSRELSAKLWPFSRGHQGRFLLQDVRRVIYDQSICALGKEFVHSSNALFNFLAGCFFGHCKNKLRPKPDHSLLTGPICPWERLRTAKVNNTYRHVRSSVNILTFLVWRFLPKRLSTSATWSYERTLKFGTIDLFSFPSFWLGKNITSNDIKRTSKYQRMLEPEKAQFFFRLKTI